MRRSLQNYRADWVEGLWVWEEQEPASWYLCASYVDWAPWIQPPGFQCPAGQQPGCLLQSHSSGEQGLGWM